MHQHDPHAVAWTRCRRPTPGTPARRWRWRRWPTRSGSAFLRFDPAGPDLAQPRPLRAVGRPRLDAAVLAAAPDRRQGGQRASTSASARRRCRSTTSSSSASSTASARATPNIAGPPASRPPPARSARACATSVGMAIAAKLAGRALTTGPASTLFDYNIYALCGDGDMMEGVAQRGRLARRPPGARQPVLDLRQQPDHHRGHDRPRLHRGRRRPLPRLRLERRCGSATPTTCEMLGRALRHLHADHDDRPTLIIVDSHIGYGSPHKQDTPHGPRRAAGRGRGPPRRSEATAGPRTRSSSCRTASTSTSPQGIGAAAQAAARSVGRAVRRVPRATIPSWPTSSTGCSTASCPRAGTRTSRPSRPTPRAWPAATSSGKVLNAVAKNVPWLIGGSADLAPSTKTRLTFEGAGDFERRQLRRPQLPLRHPRARHGARSSTACRCRRCGRTARRSSIFTDYAAAGDPALGDHGTAGRSTSSPTTRSASARTARPTSRSSSSPRCAPSPGSGRAAPGDANEVVEAWRSSCSCATSRPCWC